MPQLHFYASEEVALQVRRRAKAVGLSTSRYISEIVKREVSDGWPRNFFTEVVGSWKDEPIERPPQGEFEQRDTF